MPAEGGSTRELLVLLGENVAGILYRSDSRDPLTFEYDDGWRKNPDAYPLSLSIPLAARSHRGPALEFYLRGLLPDNQARLNAVAHRYGVSPDDSFGLLSNIGDDCAGAVQFVMPSRAKGARPSRRKVEWLTKAELGHVLRDLYEENAAGGHALATGQFSLPGALAKVALTRDPKGKRWGYPGTHTPSTHIVKAPLAGVDFHCQNEHLCLALANATGCRAASSSILRSGDTLALAVERFDRQRLGGRIVRVHQEDASQALGVDPRLKYASEGAPGIGEIVALLRDYSTAADIYRFLRAVAFNWVIAGTDAHPRNYSISIGPSGRVNLAPLYDLSSALVLPTRIDVDDLPFAMTIAGRRRIGSIDQAAWTDLAKDLRLDKEKLLSEVRDVASAIAERVASIAATGFREEKERRFAERFVKRIRMRAKECLARVM